MGLKSAIRVRETTSNKPATGATAFNLGGAVTGHRTFVAGVGDGHRCVYIAQKVDGNGNPAGAWERCIGEVDDASPDTLSRLYCLENSNGTTTFIDWSATGENTDPHVMIAENPYLGLLSLSPLSLPANADHYHRPITAPQTWASGSISAGQFVLAPFVLAVPKLLKRLRAWSTGGAGAGNMMRLGLYRSASFDFADGLDRVHWEEIEVATTGAKSSPSDLDLLLDAGIYWTGVNPELGTMTFAGAGASAQVNAFGSALLGYVSSSSGTDVVGVTGVNLDIGAYSSSALPSTVTPTGLRTSNCPLVEFKLGEP